jgi:hypothetical protein
MRVSDNQWEYIDKLARQFKLHLRRILITVEFTATISLISNAIAELSIFRHYDIDNLLHSSRDGQKFETRINTVNSRHSPKYFGLKKGIVSYTLVANHIPINARKSLCF